MKTIRTTIKKSTRKTSREPLGQPGARKTRGQAYETKGRSYEYHRKTIGNHEEP